MDVGLSSGGHVTHTGQQIRALDTGDRVNVYPAGGGWDWLLTTTFVVLSLAALSIWTAWVIRALRRRRTPPADERRFV